MSDRRRNNFHRPDSALADYLQDLLAPPSGDAAGPGVTAGTSGMAARGATANASPAAQRSAPKRRTQEWAEPPVLDPRVFRPPLQVSGQVATAAVAATSAAPASAPVTAPLPAPVAAPASAKPQPSALAKSPPPAADVAAPVAPAPVADNAGRGTPWAEGRPQWAQKPFDCLLFSVSGLKLAVPLILLGAVHPLDRELTPLVGRPKWFMGLLNRGERNTRVVDTAQWVMPERYRSDARSAYGFVIRLDDSEWGLACDQVAQSFRLNPDEVKWRSEDSRRPWLAGTVKSQMCALLDVGEFSRMLARAEKTQKFDLKN